MLRTLSGTTVIEGDVYDESLEQRTPTVNVYIDGKKYSVVLVSQGVSRGLQKYHFSLNLLQKIDVVKNSIEIHATTLGGATDYFKIEKLKPAEALSITSKPKNVPNPFRPSRGEGTTIMYNLSSDTGVKLIIYDITGKAVSQKFFSPGTEGGKAGQNNVFWDGKNDFGGYVGNGVYIYFITSGEKILSKGQMAVID